MRDRKGALVLIVAGGASSTDRLGGLLEGSGSRVKSCGTVAEANEILENEPAEVVFLADAGDCNWSSLESFGERWPGLPIVVLGEAGADPSFAEQALRAGAADYLEPPFSADQVSFILRKALTKVEMSADRPPPPPSSARAKILGNSPAMRQTYATLQRAAQGSATVLIRGESGTGKELVARAIHDSSQRVHQAFVKIDCASLPETLLESELFGYEKGAFTGAVARKLGRVELADKGTLFLDEIGELSMPLQAKLLRLLQERQFERIGGNRTLQVDARIVAATHRDLEAMVERAQFRLDLFYRLNVVPLWLPPLRARREDVEVLAASFCLTFGAANGRRGLVLEPDAMKILRAQRWPGNVRQLQNFVERLVVLAPGPSITAEQVSAELGGAATFQTQSESLGMLPTAVMPAPSEASPAEQGVFPLNVEMRAAERRALERALKVAGGNRSVAARLLNVSRSTLYNKLQEHQML